MSVFLGEAENGKLKDEIVGSVHAFMSGAKYVVRKQNKMKNKRNLSHGRFGCFKKYFFC